MAQSIDCSAGCSATCEEKYCRCKILRNHTEELSHPCLMLTALKCTETAKQGKKLVEMEQTIKSQGN